MAVSYNKLWKLLIDKGMTKTELRLQTDMSTATLAKMSKNEVVSMDIMLRICDVLECNVGDIMDATKKEDSKLNLLFLFFFLFLINRISFLLLFRSRLH